MSKPCPDCGEPSTVRGTFVEKASSAVLVLRACAACRTEWVHAKETGRWYKLRKQEGTDSRVGSKRLDLHQALGDSRAHRLGRLVAIYDVANEQAGIQMRYIERRLDSPLFVCRNWKLECETNAISQLESDETRQKLGALIQKSFVDLESMRFDQPLSVEEQHTLRNEYRRYKQAIASKFESEMSW